MGMKSEARLTSSLLARKGSAQPFPASDVFSLPPQTVVTTGAGADERAEGRRPQPTGWSSSPVTPPPARPAAPPPQAEPVAPKPARAEARPADPWPTQSIFSALKRTPDRHPAVGQADAPARQAARPAPAAKDRVALTLRVDQERHTRLRLLSAQTKRSSQDILMAALDSYIDAASQGMTFCECLKPASLCGKSD